MRSYISIQSVSDTWLTQLQLLSLKMETRDTRGSDSGFVVEDDTLPIIDENETERQSQNSKFLY